MTKIEIFVMSVYQITNRENADDNLRVFCLFLNGPICFSKRLNLTLARVVKVKDTSKCGPP